MYLLKRLRYRVCVIRCLQKDYYLCCINTHSVTHSVFYFWIGDFKKTHTKRTTYISSLTAMYRYAHILPLTQTHRWLQFNPYFSYLFTILSSRINFCHCILPYVPISPIPLSFSLSVSDDIIWCCHTAPTARQPNQNPAQHHLICTGINDIYR